MARKQEAGYDPSNPRPPDSFYRRAIFHPMSCYMKTKQGAGKSEGISEGIRFRVLCSGFKVEG